MNLFRKCVTLVLGVTVSATAFAQNMVPITPERLLDTRPGSTTIDSQFQAGGIVTGGGAGPSIDLTIAGRGAIPLTGAGAVALNITVRDSTSSTGGFLTAYPSGTTRPNASSINFAQAQAITNQVVVPIGSNGKVSLFLSGSAGQANIVADVTGYFPTTSNLVSFSPMRLLDTRAGTTTIDGQFQGGGAIASGTQLDLTVLGRNSNAIPMSGVAAVVINFTATNTTAAGFATVWPTGATRPNPASNINFVTGQTLSNLVMVAPGTGGKVSIFVNKQSDMVADIVGYFTTPLPLVPGTFVPVTPARLLDTRTGATTIDGQYAGAGALAASGGSVDLAVLGRGNVVPSSGVGAVALNVTVTGPTAGGFITGWDTGSTQPTAMDLNFATGSTLASLSILKVGANGKVSFANNSGGQTQLVVDVVGWFPATTPAPTLTSGYTIDYDNYGVVLYGTNFNASTYVAVRSTTSGPIIGTFLPPSVTYLPGSTTSSVSFRINDPSLQAMLASPGLLFYVVSPTSGFAFAGPLTIQRGTPSYASQPAAFHSAYFRPSQGSFFAMLEDDTGSPSPREQAIASINNNLQALRASGLDTVSIILPDSDEWVSQTSGGFSYDPWHFPTPQRSVGQEIFLRIAAANQLKVVFVIGMSSYRTSTDGRSAWNGLADQYGITPTSTGANDYIHALIDPTPYYGTPSTTKLSTIGLTDGPIRSYFDDPRVAGFILAPEVNPFVVSSTGVATNQYFFNKYWSNFYALVHYGGSQTAFAGLYVIGSPSDGVSTQIGRLKTVKSWFNASSGLPTPDRFGTECYGFNPYPLQNTTTDMNLIIDALVTANTAQYPGDYAIPSQKVFIGEANTDQVTNPGENQFYQQAMQLVSRRVLGGVQWFAADSYADGVPPPANGGFNLYNVSFTYTGYKAFQLALPSGGSWHNPNSTTNYADPTTFSTYAGYPPFATDWGLVSYTSPTQEGYWYGEGIASFGGGKNVLAYASPNPSSNASQLTVIWDATPMPSVANTEIHLGSPNGALVGWGYAVGSFTMPSVPNGSVLYLQDVTGSKPLTAANTLSQIYVSVH